MEAGKQRLVGGTHREADSQEVNETRVENEQLKAVVKELPTKRDRSKRHTWQQMRLHNLQLPAV